MKKSLLTLTLLCMGLVMSAALPQRLSELAKRIQTATALSVSCSANGAASSLKMNRDGAYALDMGKVKVFYDGTTQWSYSEADHQVTVFKPSPAELEQSNPAAILRGLATNFNATSEADGSLRLTPRAKHTGVTEVRLRFANAKAQWPSEMVIVSGSGQLRLTAMKFYTHKTKFPTSAFQFQAPKGTEVINL